MLTLEDLCFDTRRVDKDTIEVVLRPLDEENSEYLSLLASSTFTGLRNKHVADIPTELVEVEDNPGFWTMKAEKQNDVTVFLFSKGCSFKRMYKDTSKQQRGHL